MNVNPIVNLPMLGDGWKRGLEFVDEAHAAGYRVHPQSQLQQMQVFFALHDTFLFDEMRGVPRGAHRRRPPGGAAARSRRARPHAAGLRAHRGPCAGLHLGRGQGGARRRPSRVAGAHRRRSRRATGASIRSTRSSTRRSPKNCGRRSRSGDRSAPRPDATTEEVVRHPASLPGSSDAGAHLTSYCGVDFSTRLLSEYVPDVVSLEEAVRRLATIPAQLYGFADRGWLGAGARADLVVWDPLALGDRGHAVVGGLPRGRWALRRRRRPATARSSSTARWSDATAPTPACGRVGCSARARSLTSSPRASPSTRRAHRRTRPPSPRPWRRRSRRPT